MAKRSRRSIVIFLHRWLGLVVTIFVVLFALSGMVLNHRAAVARLHVSRSWLPEQFAYDAWNQGAVKGAVPLDEREILLYGSIGIWRANNDFTQMAPCNEGLPAGADRRQIERIFRTADGDLLAGTRYGLYRFVDERWRPLPLPSARAHVVDIAQKDDLLYVLTRSEVWVTSATRLDSWRSLSLPTPPGWDGRVPLFRVLWDLHDGTLFGLPGRLVVDLLALAFLLLSATALLLFAGPRWIKWRKHHGATSMARTARVLRWARVWHRRIGIAMAAFLITLVALGMCLRPPLLIAIARKRVTPWPGTALHDGGPWHDRLRRLHYDAARDRFVLSTADGFYLFDKSLESAPQRPLVEPPVSVMGVKVFEEYGSGLYLVGSFSGLYMWSPDRNAIVDWIRKQPPPQRRSRRPVGRDMVSGYVRDAAGREFVFDYRRGVVPLRPGIGFPPMPEDARKTPLSLWHLALEMHTGRLYACFPKGLQVFWVALSGLAIVMVLVSGVCWWWKLSRRRRSAGAAAAEDGPATTRDGKNQGADAVPNDCVANGPSDRATETDQEKA